MCSPAFFAATYDFLQEQAPVLRLWALRPWALLIFRKAKSLKCATGILVSASCEDVFLMQVAMIGIGPG